MKEILILAFIIFLVLAFLIYALSSNAILNAKIKKEAAKKGYINVQIKKTEKAFDIKNDSKNRALNFVRHNILIDHGLSVYQKIPKKLIIPSSAKSKKIEVFIIAETYFLYPVKVHFQNNQAD